MAHRLDGSALDTPAGTLGELLDAARRRLGGERLVVEVRCDGRVLDAEEIEVRMLRPLEADEIQLQSARPAELAVSALDGALDRLAQLGEQQREAAERLQADEAGAAYSLLGDALAGWTEVSSAVSQSCELTGVPLGSLTTGGGSGADVAAGLAASLREVRTQIEAQDTIGLADSLAYVWPDVVERWEALIGSLQERLGRA
ncbi:hypothetical protein [Phycisphaera mikurensis]|uniref:Uncharacterized protein n=1 Tax=Phycisphaera mikurensis (strain NBRC 102666 / KCTC 22515 / FYK2301M01) TaxID=1142394 RepID=I0IF42_PHYMF|nr:hypothetical protein [Phycisphaera mikurensis]MBB6440724.1 hypothetical protein [Phycisphaera mikurensis]BAM03880.1 hypothetical protein PSMK_17210 [Phycisphaera mikurensis NBRC 102666]